MNDGSVATEWTEEHWRAFKINEEKKARLDVYFAVYREAIETLTHLYNAREGLHMLADGYGHDVPEGYYEKFTVFVVATMRVKNMLEEKIRAMVLGEWETDEPET